MKNLNFTFKSIVQSKARWLLTFFAIFTLGMGQMWAGTSTTVYYAVPAATVGCYTVKLNVAYQYNNGKAEDWHQFTMSKTGNTKDGNVVFSYTYTDSYNGVGTMQFQLYDGGTHKGQQQPYGSWTDVSNYNGKVYVHNTGWTTASWDASYTVYFVNHWNWGAVRAYAWNSSCDYNAGHPGSEMVNTGLQKDGHDIYRLTLNKRYEKIQFNCNSSDCKEDNLDCYSNRGKMFENGTGWFTPTYDGYTFSNGATVVWDAGNESWTSAYLYNYNLDGENDITLTRIGSTTQFSKTATSSVKTGSWIIRKNTSWGAAENQTTDITSDISGVTLFNYCNTKSDGKLDWQKTTNAKKFTSGKKIYFDNTATGWSNIYLKYGTQWFVRKTSAATKVNGTANLYYITIPDNTYYKEYYLSNAVGSYGYANIETMTSISGRTAYQPYNFAADSTLIATTGSGTGTSGNPKVWSVTKMAGHTHRASITAPTNGTITVSYTNESGSSASFTSGYADVARTCTLNISAAGANGYDRSTLTVNSSDHTSGANHTITSDITIAATFTAHTYNITLNAGDHGAAAGSATVVFNTSSLASASHVTANAGYALEGYYDGETKVLNDDGSFADTNVTGYITSGKWSKYDADATLTAKFTPVSLTFNATSTSDWSTAGNWSPACVPTIAHDVVIAKPVVVNATDAKAKSVKIYNDGGETNTGKLTINAGKKLVVATTITKTTDGSNSVATTAEDLVIDSDGSNGVGALVWGTASTSPGAAQVNFYTTSGGKKNDYGSINQFIGTPFLGGAGDWIYDYYDSWVLKVDYSDHPVFVLLNSGEAMNPFEGYCVIYNGSAGHIYDMSGTLVTNADVTCSGLHYSSGSGAANMYNENLLANSWTAPIKINAMSADDDFTNTEASIYIFNSTSQTGLGGEEAHVGIGNYSQYTVGTAEETDIIPSMQSFSVFTTGSGGSVTLDYNRIVYTPASGTTVPAPNLAPRRAVKDEASKVRLFVSTESGYGDMVYMWEHANFSENFENGWDGHKLFGEAVAPQLYAVTPDGNMAVNCVPAFEGTLLGFKAGSEDNVYTFTFDYSEDETPLYLIDMNTQIYTRVLKGNEYIFSTSDTDAHNRFVLTHNAPSVVTGIDNFGGEIVSEKAVKFIKDGRLYIIRDGKIYNAIGAIE